jgi:hypothetical protein
MSYIGKNPKADSVKLNSTAVIPTGAAVEGQVYYNDGTGTISEGLKVYKNGNFVGIDKQLGDADTIALKKAVDVGSLQWAVAIDSTGATVGMNAPVPQYDATATGFADSTNTTFSNTSNTNALLTDESADLVFAYESHTVNSKNDYYGIQIDIPKAFRGGNLVLEFEYRTEEASGATSDDDFRVSVQDNTTANRGQTAGGTSITGSQAAGTSILVGSSTNFTVGDRVRVESGTGVQGAQANDFTEAYVTAIADATHLTFSQTIVFPSTDGGLIAGGWLTDKVQGQLQKADSDTNKIGKKRSIQFKTEETTETVNVTFQNLSTSAAGIDLFVDNILLSANKFLQANTRGKTASGKWNQDGQYLTNKCGEIEYDLGSNISIVKTDPILDDYIIAVDDSTNTRTKWIAQREIEVAIQWSCNVADQYLEVCIGLNGVAIIGGGGFYNLTTSYTGVLQKGDYLTVGLGSNNDSLGFDSTSCVYGSTSYAVESVVNITATPQVNDVIILESQDEIFTDWVDWTPTGTHVTNTTYTGKWRRNGPDMEVLIQIAYSGDPGVQLLEVDAVPSGYSVDENKLTSEYGNLTYAPLGRSQFYDTNGPYSYPVRVSYNGAGTNRIKFWALATNATVWGYYEPTQNNSGYPFTFASGDFAWARISIPIQGWNANFNPLLSMPLVDFGTFENTYTAVIDTSALSVISESSPFIKSVTGTTGEYTITYVDDMFTQTPSVVVTPFINSASLNTVNLQSSVATTCDIECVNNSGAYTAIDFVLSITRQGSDYKQPPQPTAAVIKPAVAIIEDVKAYNADGGTAASGAWNDRDLNTLTGESWFVTLADPAFTLEPGTYKIKATAPFYGGNYGSIRLYNNTDSAVVKYSNTTYTANPGNLNTLNAVVTIGSSTAYKIQYRCSQTSGGNGLGVNQSTDSTAVSIYTQVVIEKLK